MNGIGLGIDFGNTNIKVSYITNNKIKTLSFNDGGMRSDFQKNIIVYNKNEILLGYIAEQKFLENENENDIIYCVKKELLKNKEDSNTFINSRQITLNSVEILGDMLKEIVKTASEKNGGQEITNCIITIPVNFSELQKERIKKACKLAQLNLDGLLTEPIAGGLGLLDDIDDLEDGDKYIIFDFGGGTLDIVLLEIEKNEDTTTFKVLGSAGVTYGGSDLTEDILEKCVVPKINTPEVLQDKKNRIEIIREVEKAKETCLGEEDGSDFTIVLNKNILQGLDSDQQLKITQEEMIDVIDESKIKDKIIRIFDFLLEDSMIEKDEIKQVITIGGSSRISEIKKVIYHYFEDDDIYDIDDMYDDDDIFLSVSKGAARFLQHLIDNNEQFELENKNSFRLYAKNKENRNIILGSKFTSFKTESALKLFKNISSSVSNEAIIYQQFDNFDDEEQTEIVIGKVLYTPEKYDKDGNIYYSVCIDNKGEISFKFYQHSAENFIEENKIIIKE